MVRKGLGTFPTSPKKAECHQKSVAVELHIDSIKIVGKTENEAYLYGETSMAQPIRKE